MLNGKNIHSTLKKIGQTRNIDKNMHHSCSKGKEFQIYVKKVDYYKK